MSAQLPDNDRANMMRTLVARHEPQIRAIICGRSGARVLCWTTVDDLVQDTAAAAIAGAHAFTYRGDGPFLAWIRVLALRIVARSLNDRERRMLQAPAPNAAKPSAVEPTEVVPDDEAGPSTICTLAERAQTVRDAIDGLPDRYRKVLTLYRLEERPLGQVAAELGCTKGATARLMDRALKQLRTRLKAI